MNASKHLEILDAYGGEKLLPFKQNTEAAYRLYMQLKQKCAAFASDQETRLREMDFCRFEIEEIENAALKDGEEEKVAADFIYWLYSSDTGKKFVTDALGFIAPFDTFSAEDVPEDPLAVQVQLWMNKQGVYSIPWDFTVFPSQTFKQHFGSALLSYAQGRKTWAQVQENTVADWKSEAAASA